MIQRELTHLNCGFNDYAQLKGNSDFSWNSENGLQLQMMPWKDTSKHIRRRLRIAKSNSYKSGTKKTPKSTVNDGIGSVYNVLKDATNQVVVDAPPSKTSLAMKHFKEVYSEMYSDEKIAQSLICFLKYLHLHYKYLSADGSTKISFSSYVTCRLV